MVKTLVKFVGFFLFRQFKAEIQVQSDQAQREARKGDELKKELSQAKSDLENRTAELKTKTENLQRAQEDITKLDQQLKEQRVNLLRVSIQFSFVFKRSCQYSRDRKKTFRLPLVMDTSLIREEWLSSVDDNIWFILDNE